MKTGKINCDDLSEETDDCALEVILREIINNQNAQIQTMRALLESKGYPEENDCKVTVSTSAASSSIAKLTGVSFALILSSLYLIF